ncbi:MAG: DNA internalization-related competence protein ComEC/Rec2 [Dehalococcoidales bacterium]|nr:DNA internalization-related competence protein ComEC/Rec2 [Dehalococcoidales bacterium]MDD3264840.1 DNA internalization-related competence protein ComEC/Rec2 [Dehalococcoidales bacterium]
MKLLWLCCLFLAGIITGSRLDVSWWVLLIALLPLPLILYSRIGRKALWGCAGLLLLAVGMVLPPSASAQADPEFIAWHNESGEVTVRATIEQEVGFRDSSQHLYLSCQKVGNGGEVYDTRGKLLVYASRYPEYAYGDELLLTGMLENPPVFTSQTSGEVEFDYAAYLANQDIFSVMYYPEMKVVSGGNGNPLLAGIYGLKQKLALNLERVLPEPDSSLACGILLGQRHKIPQHVQDNFSYTGVFHLLAISGLHLGIIAAMALSTGRTVFGRRGYVYIFLALGVIWLYAVIAGFGAPVARAAIMASMFLFAELLGRQKNMLPALALSAAIMVAIDPRIIATASFQMSFSAMAGIILLYPACKAMGAKLVTKLFGQKGRIRAILGAITDGLAVGLAATIFVLPLTLHYFGIFTPMGPLVTLVMMVALIPLIITSGLAGALGFFWPAGAMLAGWFCHLFTGYMLRVTEWFSSSVKIYSENVSLHQYWAVAFYIAVLAVYWGMKVWKRRKKREEGRSPVSGLTSQSGCISASTVTRLLLVAVCVLVIIVPSGCRQDERLSISFLDVGQGDAILISQGNTHALIDGGPSPQVLMECLAEKISFFDRNIDLVILTHPHADHINGLLEVLRRYDVRQVIHPGTGDRLNGYESQAYRRWLEVIENRQIPVTEARAGMSFTLGEAVFKVLNPGHELHRNTVSDIDNNSIVIELEAGDFNFLLTGDLMWQGELEMVMERRLNQVDILKVAHHGSSTSSSREFLSVARPDMGIICVGENNFGHPDNKVIERISTYSGEKAVLRTDEHGGITFLTDGDLLWLEAGTS